MEAFLEQVGKIYLDKELSNLGEYCFVFPNKRSATFFGHLLLKNGEGKRFIFPETKTISEFVADFSPLVEATRYEQLFILYNEYKKLSSEIAEFDKFLFWGDMLINDFNDVDKYLVDPKSLFTNVKDIKEINSSYLTEEQLNIIREFWGEDSPGKQIEEFWSHISYPGKEGKGHNAQHKFRKLWEILNPLYQAYRKALKGQGISSNGMYYRNAVERLSSDSEPPLPYRRYIFVGFNVLSTSELKIFSILRKAGKGDYYWDFNSPAFEVAENRATRFIASNMKHFPSIYDTSEERVAEFPSINIVGVPSNVGQAKFAGQQVGEWVKEKIISDPANAIDTAVVLPDESLFIPMIHSVPESIKSLNITMGFPMRHTHMASILRNIVSLQLRARLSREHKHYYYEDIRDILSQPLVREIAPDECDCIMKELKTKRRFMVDAEELAKEYPTLSKIFVPIGGEDTLEGAYRYLTEVTGLFLDYSITHPDIKDSRLQIHFLRTCQGALDSLYRAGKIFGIAMRHATFFRMFERAVASETVNFVGEPLKGLQVMGVLETRSLDFKNVIMLSMNERIFPRRQYTSSFIPDTLRRGFGMATMDFQESIFAYYFYRLISRAEHVTLIYDARTVGGKSSEISRYISQLLYIYNREGKSVHKLAIFPGRFFAPNTITVAKDKEILEKLEKFTTEDKAKAANLSASAINTYITCPLKFYLQYVEGYLENDEIKDYMDASTLGTIVHAVAQRIYEEMGSRKGGSLVTPDMLNKLADPRTPLLERYVTEQINEKYHNLGRGNREKLVGESLILGRVIVTYLRNMLRLEAEKGEEFVFVKAEADSKKEFEAPVRYRVNENLTVNLRRIIDRIDRMGDGSLRFIDYKTGKDPLVARNLTDLIRPQANPYPKAIFQLLLYCNVYRVDHNYDGPIQPMIYSFGDMARSHEIKPLVIEKESVKDYRDINDRYLPLLHGIIAEIFNPEIPFRQAEGDHHCKYCQFRAICAREDKEKK